jgi:hypothetical protein
MRQKDTISIGDITVFMALKFEPNYRERSPVVGEIIEGNKLIKSGQIAIFHHNHFYAPSPYFVQDDLFSVPFNQTVFGILTQDGDIEPMCGNIICERIEIPTFLPLPPEHRKTYIDRVRVLNPGTLSYPIGHIIFHTPNAGYDIVYNYNGAEKRVTKVHSDFVVGYVT